jgi:hypothetical protein
MFEICGTWDRISYLSFIYFLLQHKYTILHSDQLGFVVAGPRLRGLLEALAVLVFV